MSQLTSIAEDTLRLQSKSGDIKGLDDDEKFFTHTADLVRTCRHYLEKNAELLTAKEDHLANRVEKCATRNVALHQHVTQNHFDQQRIGDNFGQLFAGRHFKMALLKIIVIDERVHQLFEVVNLIGEGASDFAPQ